MLEAVAARRIKAGWGLESVEGYDLLIAPADCELLGKTGWLFVEDKVYRVISVDCEQSAHQGQMDYRGLLLDQPLKELVHKDGWLVLR